MEDYKNFLKLSITAEEYEKRIQNVQKEIEKRNIDLGIIYCTPNKPGDLLYLTGIDPNVFDAGAIITREKLFVLGGFETHEFAMDTMKAGEYKIIEGYDVVGDWPGVKFNKIEDVLKEASPKIKKLGLLTSKDVISIGFLEKITQELSGVEVVDATDIIANLRYIKSEMEQNIIKASNVINTEAMKKMIDTLSPGLRELEIASEGDYIIKKLGARSYGFDVVVLSGKRAEANIGRASNKIIEKGDMVVLGISTRFEGYACGLGRTLVAGSASKEQVQFLEHGIKALEMASGNVKYNQPAKFIDLAPRKYLKSVGLGDYQYYSVGHGSGIHECLEEKGADQFSNYLLPKNIIMQVDVGIFGHPSFHGARHEDPFLINNKGETERLTDLPTKVYH